ncbi:hypothetical protein LWI29_020379 [Acer saccharum]|uniref:Uncharacterized protein n=1 Tax=Acer saccharum TaxID=4024 RepID=A0AA39SW76_ACESA|nr:hypothetical protein LWI29_020379 [Acer saccharum]
MRHKSAPPVWRSNSSMLGGKHRYTDLADEGGRRPPPTSRMAGAVASEFHDHDHDLLSQSSMVPLLQMMLMIIIMISNVVPAAVAVVDVVILSYDQKSFN